MNEFHRRAAIISLKTMFASNHFSICTIDNIIKLTGCLPDPRDYQALRALHCVNWIDMGAEMRNLVMMKVGQIFEQPGLDTRMLDETLKEDRLKLN